MKRIILLSFSLLLFNFIGKAQIAITVSGTATTNPALTSTYTSLANALTALNAVSSYTTPGTIVFTMTASGTEIAPPTGLTIGSATLNPLLSSSNTVTIVKASGTVTLNAGVGTATPSSTVLDGLLKISGADFITIDGLTLTDGNAANPATMEYGIGLFKLSLSDGAQNNTIQNCTINLKTINNASGTTPMIEGSVGILMINSTAAAATTVLTPTTAAGTNSNNKFYSNTINGGNYGMGLIGFAGVSPFTTCDQGTIVGAISLGNIIQNFGGGAVSNPSAAIRTLAQYTITIGYNTINNNTASNTNHATTFRGIFLNTAVSASATVTNNTVTLKSGATSSSVTAIENASGSTAASNTISITNNTITGCTYTTATTGTFTGILQSATPATTNITNNTLTGTILGTSTVASSCVFQGLYNSASNGTNPVNINANTIINNVINNQGGTMYCIRASTADIRVNSNTINNNTIPLSGGSVTCSIYGYYNLGSATIETYNLNNIDNLSISGSSTSVSSIIRGMHTNTVSSSTINSSGNNINTLTYNNSSSGACSIYGMSFTLGTVVFSKNKIYNITANGVSSTAYGVNISGGTTVTLANNLIGDIKTPTANAAIPLAGINITSGTAVNLYYNTVYLNTSSTGALFGSSALYASITPTLILRNNIFVNLSTPTAATGYTTAYRRTSTTLTSYSATSNNNLFYGSSPGTNNLIFYDGTNSSQTIALYKTFMSTRDQASVSESSTFVSTTGGSAQFLELNGTVASQAESGGVAISGFTDSYNGTGVRTGYPQTSQTNGGGTAPDMGAYEGNYTPSDQTGPIITYTAFSNTSSTSDRTLNVTITDASGVPTFGAGLPVLNWKINAGAYSLVTATYISGSTYQFVFGSGVVPTDVVSYYIAAQDNSASMNVSVSPASGASGLTSNPPAASTIPTSPSTYTILNGINGSFDIGATKTSPNYTTLTNALSDISSKEINGTITLNIDADYDPTLETAFPVIINELLGASSINTVTIKPKTGVTKTITGNSATSIIKIYGGDYITIDGSNNGTISRDLTIENTNTATSGNAVIWLASPASGNGSNSNTIKNCIIQGNASTTTFLGMYIGGTASISLTSSGVEKNNTNTITSNLFKKTQYGIALFGYAAAQPDLNNIISNNNFGTATTGEGFNIEGIHSDRQQSLTVSGNDVQNIRSITSTAIYGIRLLDFKSGLCYNNLVHNIAYTSTSTTKVYGIAVLSSSYALVGNPSAANIYNNAIYDITSTGTATDWNLTGILASQGYGDKFYYNSVNLAGQVNNSSSGLSASFANGNGSLTTPGTNVDIRNNIFSLTGTSLGGPVYAYYSKATSFSGSTQNNNILYAAGTGASTYTLGYFNSTAYTTLSAWQTATGVEANSLAVNPQYNNATVLKPQLGSPALNAGVTITGFTADILGVTRSVSTPTIGAYETGVDGAGPNITYTTLGNTALASNRSITAVAITDVSGVNTTIGTKPRLYFKKSTDANTYVGNTSGDNGWKYAESTSSASPFDFTIDYNIINGGSVTGGNTVQYFIVAQDLAATPNVGINSGTFSATPTSVNLTSGAFPLTGTINQYLISAAFTGSYDVGTSAATYTTLKSFFDAINAGVVTGNISVNIVGTCTESTTASLSQWSEEPASSNFTMTISPSGGAARLITGTLATATVKLDGADRVTIDGLNTGGNTLTIENLSVAASSAAIWMSSQGTGLGATNNAIKNSTIKGGSNTVANYGIVIGGTTIASNGADNDNNTIQNNTINTCAIGIYAIGTAAGSTGGIDNLTLSGNAITINTTAAVIGIEVGNGTGGAITQNQLSVQTTNTAVAGISIETGFLNATVTRNLLSNVTTTATNGYGGRGITVGTGSASSNITLSNNVIYGVSGSNFSSFTNSSSMGIGLGMIGNTSTLTTTTGGINLYYNSINMYGNYAYAGACLTTGLYVGSGVTALDLRNNIFKNSLNNTDLSGTGSKNYVIYSAASNTAFSNINYNDYFVSGTQGVLAFLTSDRTDLTGIQSGFGGNVNSSTANPNFNSNTILQPQTGSPVLAAGAPISGITTDYSGTTRSGTTPSIGAYENGSDGAPPVISYTTLGNISSTTNRSLTSVVITDASGVNTTPGTKPRLYFKKSTDANTYVGNTSGDNGWKYVESTSSASPFDFTINYSIINGGSISGGNIIQYFIAAQDLAATPNVGINSGTFSATPTSVNLTSAAFPLTGTINQYLISAAFTGSYDVGTGAATYTTLKSFFDAINSGVVTGNITVNIVGTCTESTTASLSQWSEEPASSNFTMSISPSGGASRLITGTLATATVKLDGADRVTIDGLNTGGNTLTIENLSVAASSAAVWLSSQGTGLGATNNAIKNSTIKGGSNTVANYGIVIGGTTIPSNGADNDNTTIQNNTINTCANGIYAIGTAAVSTGGIDNLTLSGNVITINTTAAVIGIEVGNGTGGSISQNQLNVQTSGTAVAGISIETGFLNATVTRNLLSNVTTTATGGYGGRGITAGTASASSNITISNNVIYGVNGSNYSSFTNSSSIGIGLGMIGNSTTLTTTTGGINLYYNSINMYGNYAYASACLTTGLYVGSGVTALDIRNNIFKNSLNNTDLSGTVSKNYAIYSAAANTAFTSINNNDYFVSGTQGVLAFLTSDRTTLAALQTGFGSNINSYNINPGFTSTTNLLEVANAFPSNYLLGSAISGITTDFAGLTRSSTPDLGAYEGSDANRWIGVTSTAFTTGSNWDDGNVPSSGQSLTISSYASNSPVLTASYNANNLYIGAGQILGLNANTLLIDGALSGTGTLKGNGSLTIQGSGAFGTVSFDQTIPGTTNKLTNLTYNRSAQTITLGNVLQVSGTVTPTAGTLETSGFLTLLSSSTSDGNIAQGSGSYLTGTVSVQRFIPGSSGRKYRYLAAPFITGPTIGDSWQQQIYITGTGTGGTACPSLTSHTNGFDASTYNNYSMTTFNETTAIATASTPNVTGATIYTNAWTGVPTTNATNLAAGIGYNTFIRGARSQGCGLLDGTNPTPNDVTLSATGTITTGSFTIPVTYNASNGQGWNLVGNPYPSAIDWDAAAWTKTNMSSTIWIYRPSNDNIATYNGTTGINGGGNIIPSGQGFYVKATASSPILAVTEAVKTSAAATVLLLKGNKPFEIRLTLKNSANKSDETVVVLNKEKTDLYDGDFDAEKMNNPSNVNLFTIDAMNAKYGINGIATIVDRDFKIVPLGIGAAFVGNYTIDMEAPNLPSYYQLFLRDHYLLTEKQLTNEDKITHSFNVTTDSASFGNQRFDLYIKNERPHSNTGIGSINGSETEVNVYPNPTLNILNVSIIHQVKPVSSLVLYNTLGQIVNKINNPRKDEVIDLSGFESGIYFLQVMSENDSVLTFKVIKK
ncbi:MAG: T9SS type A sorting domain-containing protein [Bacteroidia bacterium]|nr:T9SS type A sorting domain-containing protein [Bacteroidia bacterium]